MSQSDYLKYKRVSTRLRVDNDTTNQPPVFQSSTLRQNKQYALVNSITNTKPKYNRLIPSERKSVFGMEKAVGGCPAFIICSNTNLRTNRVPMTCRADPTVPSPEPLNIRQRNDAVNLKNACKCALHRSYTDENSCSCKLGAFGIVR